MRSSRSVPNRRDPLQPGPRGFAHRGRHGPPLVENSLAAAAAAMEMGAGMECDVRLTADGELVVFHDADAVRLTGESRIVRHSTLADLRALDVGGRPIPTLAELLVLIGGRVPLLVEAKSDPRRGEYCRALASTLAGYRGAVGLMSFDPWLVAWIRHKLPEARRGLVIRDRLGPVRRWLAIRLARPHFLAVETSALPRLWVRRVRARMPVYSWTVTTAKQRQALAPLADALIWEGDGRP
ncbi:glycerophosphodiester phosphodiesterase family protein [Sphingomonas sp. ASV193]|uniref:glycerophosphodiester phosphodiesterase family protein n=1 Tax=Sphingomonas sp. ASV193 TaxID=3144405 RepID=UPI0032E8F660